MLQELSTRLTPHERTDISLHGLDAKEIEIVSYLAGTTGIRAVTFFELQMIVGLDNPSFSRAFDHLNDRRITTSGDISVNGGRKIKSVYVAPSVRNNLQIMTKKGYMPDGGTKPAIEDAGEILTTDYLYVTNSLSRSKDPERQKEAKRVIDCFSSADIRSIDEITNHVARSRVAERMHATTFHPLYKDVQSFNRARRTYLDQGIISYQQLLDLLTKIDPNTKDIRIIMELDLQKLIKESNFIAQVETPEL